MYPDDRPGARNLLEGFRHHLGEACVGSISEIFDAQEPYTPRGCIAQAWSVAEVLRCLEKTAGETERPMAVVETGQQTCEGFTSRGFTRITDEPRIGTD